jgi:magnesium and cobalt transporter
LLDAKLNRQSVNDKLILANFVDKSIPFMPETKLIGSALKELRENNSEIIFVIDEYGGVTGMVTIHDIAEEIAGEFASDADDDKPFIAFHKKGVDCEGRFDIDDLGELFNVKFDKDGYETIAGLILKLAGKVPARGESFYYKNLKFTVLRSDNKRIYRVRVSPVSSVN